jgi:hypothetical protein
MDDIENSDLSDDVISDSDNSIYINIDISTEEHIDINEINSDKFSDTEIDTNSDSNLKSDISNVIDNRYLINNEKIRIIF